MRIAIITGASSGIGREFALVAAAKYRFDRIWLIARREDRLRETAALMGTQAEIIPVDLTVDLSLKVICEKLHNEKPVVQLLVNSAGFGKFGTVESQSADDIAGMIDLNVKALTMLTKMCIPYMAANGAVINLASASSFLPMPYMNVYSATKAYVLHFSAALAEELKNSGIAVTAVCPYWTDTEFIPVAQDAPQGDSVNNFMFMTYSFTVAIKALENSERGDYFSFPTVIPRVIRCLSKLLPETVQMAVWDRIRYFSFLRCNQQYPVQLPLQ